jgi:Cu(I)/Ag(I) efflux system periplasmic protein CusF
MSSRVAVAILAAAMALGSTAPAVLAADNHAAAPQTAQGMGVIMALDAKAGTVTIKHDPIAALKWPAMTMKFKVESAEVLNGVTAGKKVHFILKNDNGKPIVTAIHLL